MSEQSENQRAVVALLRQLSIGLSAYRLFPGNLEQPAFAAAAQRIVQAAQRALADGPVEVEVRGEGFATEEGPIPREEAIERLARACYERGAERLRVRAAPEPSELAAVYDTLTMPVEEVAAGGGPAAMVRLAGVGSIALGEVAPQAVEVSRLAAHSLRTAGIESMEWITTSIGLPDDALAPGVSAPDLAESLFSRFQAVVGALPPEMAEGIDLYRMLHHTVAELPEEQRRALNGVLVDRSRLDPLAERYVGTMSDTELARVLADLAEGGMADPRQLAEAVVQAGIRGRDLVDLTAAVAAGKEDAGTVVAGVEPGVDPDQVSDDPAVYETVSDLLGRSLLSHEQEDLGSIRAQYPSTEQEQHELAALSVGDYLGLEPDLDRLERVLASWMGEARMALRRRDLAGLARLLHVVEAPEREAVQGDRERALLFDVYRRQIPERVLVREMVASAQDDAEQAQVQALLAPLGEAPVDVLLDVLAVEGEGRPRAVMLNVLAGFATTHVDRVAARLSDPNWRVVRDAVTILHRSGGPDAAPLVERASRHREAAVRREAVWGLIAVGGARAAPRLRELADDPDESVRTLAVGALGGLVSPAAVAGLTDVARRSAVPAIRRQALEQLGRHPAPEATAALADLAGARSRPRLPRALRRQAKALHRERNGVGR